MIFQPIEQTGNCFRVRLDASHKVYQAHFPGNPITPGVCLLECVEYLTGVLYGRSLKLHQIKNVKFTSVLDPRQSPEASVEIEANPVGDLLGVHATIRNANGEAVAKISCVYE